MDEIYLSAKELAQQIDSKVRTIENWAANGNIEQNEKGKYGLISALKYQNEKLSLELGRTKLLLQEKEAELDRSDDELVKKAFAATQRKTIAEADKEEALARIKKLEADKLEEILIEAEEVKAVWVNAIANVKAKFINLPAKLALELSGLTQPAQIQDRLTKAIDEALIELGRGV
ncbi:MAG: hypothetical protein AAGE96_05415 [Cyanobacteria bacterium P01_G01_bin.19]